MQIDLPLLAEHLDPFYPIPSTSLPSLPADQGISPSSSYSDD